MQVFDLMKLGDVTAPPVEFEEDAHYDGFSAHNLVMNEETNRLLTLLERTPSRAAFIY